MAELWFVTGGARSGKSSFAERLAASTARPVVYVATMVPGDEELRLRIAAHRAQRPPGWSTLEAPRDLLGAIDAADPGACVLVDCISLWVTNRLLPLGEAPAGDALAQLEGELAAELDRVVAATSERAAPLIAVSNEVGGGVVPEYPLGRAYRDLLGRANQQLAAAASRAWLLVAGRAIELPPSAQP